VLHGADDTLLPPAHGEHTVSLIQGARLQIFRGMGHNIPEPVLPELPELPELIALMVARLNSTNQTPGINAAGARQFRR